MEKQTDEISLNFIKETQNLYFLGRKEDPNFPAKCLQLLRAFKVTRIQDIKESDQKLFIRYLKDLKNSIEKPSTEREKFRRVLKTDRCPSCSEPLHEEHLKDLYILEFDSLYRNVKEEKHTGHHRPDDDYLCLQCFEKKLGGKK